jgi:hypothetical protein
MFRFVHLTGDETCADCNALGQRALGISRNNVLSAAENTFDGVVKDEVAAGKATAVTVLGVQFIEAGAAIARDALVTSDAVGRAVTAVAGGPAVAATGVVDPAGANNSVVYTAQDEGEAGNGISIEYLGSTGNNVALAVVVNGNDIVVTPATDGAGVITSTADDVKAAIAASGPANALVSSADSAANDGTGLVAAVGPIQLAGGSDVGGGGHVVNGRVLKAAAALGDWVPCLLAGGIGPRL